MAANPLSSKNLALSPAAQDLGLGDMLKVQLDDADMERKKKLLMGTQGFGLGQALSPATMQLFGGSPLG